MNNKFEYDISIIIPIYNVEEYLDTCLYSVASSIGNIRLQVIMIDDGSLDRSVDIAKKFAKKYNNFFYYYKENGGLGNARNYGIQYVKGKYIAFLDSDDMVKPDMYYNMFQAAELNNCELVICNAARFNSKKVWKSALHERTFNDIPNNGVTNIFKDNNLIYDAAAWNKLILTSFYKGHNFKWPENILYEDIPVTIPMHILARRVALIPKVEYMWRVRDGESKSITQTNSNVRNLNDRLKIASMLLKFFNQYVNDANLLHAVQIRVLRVDLLIFVDMCRCIDDSSAILYLKKIKEFMYQHIDFEKLAYLSILTQQKYQYVLNEDIKALRKLFNFSKRYMHTTTIQNNTKIDLPLNLFSLPNYSIKNNFLEYPPINSIDKIDYKNGILEIYAHTYFFKISIENESDQQISAALRNNISGKKILLPVEHVKSSIVTDVDGKVYNWSKKRWDTYNYDGTTYKIIIDLNKLPVYMDNDNLIQISYSNKIKSGSFILKGLNRYQYNNLYQVKLWGGSMETHLHADDIGHAILTVNNKKYNEIDNELSLIIDSCIIKDKGISFIGDFVDDVFINKEQYEFILFFRSYIDASDYALSNFKEICIDQKIHVHFDVDFNAIVTKNIYNNNHDLYIKIIHKGLVVKRVPLYCKTPIIKEILLTDMHILIGTNSHGQVFMTAVSVWKKDENTENKRSYISDVLYKQYRKEPLNQRVVFFESMWGRKYSCNPMHFYKWLNKKHPEYICVWSLNDPHIPIEGNVIRVRRKSKEYYHYLATAKYLINNVNFDDKFNKRPDQIEIQTMHGTPYKTLGLDVKTDFKTKESRNKFINKCQRWDYLIVQGIFSETMSYRWFHFYKTLLLTGYPRTDEFMNVKEERKRYIKEKLGLPLDKKIILYAPTWRTKNHFELKLDIESCRKKLSKDYILLIRMHHLVGKGYYVPEDNQFIYDLTSYENIEDLYLITDILITDYSSIMFDFAITNKPMIFFTYDLDEYTENLRGAYFNLQKEAPGAFAFTSDEIILEIQHIDVVTKEYEQRVQEFKRKYLTYECNNSCEKIYDMVFIKHYESQRAKIVRISKKILPSFIIRKVRKVKRYFF